MSTPNTYEALVILKPILDMDNSDVALKKIEDALEGLKGKITKKEKLGRKPLAYEILKFKFGFMVTFTFQMDPKALVAFRRECKLNEDILRVMIVTRTEAQLAEIAKHRAERDARPEHPGGGRGGFDRGDRDRGPRHHARA